jgi:hypothetical protein
MPKIKIEGNVLGIIARIDKLNDLKINKNIIKIIINTAIMVLICESNRLCSILLYSTNIPVVWKLSFLKPISFAI